MSELLCPYSGLEIDQSVTFDISMAAARAAADRVSRADQDRIRDLWADIRSRSRRSAVSRVDVQSDAQLVGAVNELAQRPQALKHVNEGLIVRDGGRLAIIELQTLEVAELVEWRRKCGLVIGEFSGDPRFASFHALVSNAPTAYDLRIALWRLLVSVAKHPRSESSPLDVSSLRRAASELGLDGPPIADLRVARALERLWAPTDDRYWGALATSVGEAERLREENSRLLADMSELQDQTVRLPDPSFVSRGTPTLSPQARVTGMSPAEQAQRAKVEKVKELGGQGSAPTHVRPIQPGQAGVTQRDIVDDDVRPGVRSGLGIAVLSAVIGLLVLAAVFVVYRSLSEPDSTPQVTDTDQEVGEETGGRRRNVAGADRRGSPTLGARHDEGSASAGGGDSDGSGTEGSGPDSPIAEPDNDEGSEGER